MGQRTAAMVALGLLAGAALAAAAPASAQDYPTRTVTLVVPYPPGGGVDVLARVVADKLSGVLGHQVVVDNRVGGSGLVGTRTLIRSAPDGYTLMLGHTGSIGINPTLYVNAGFDPRKDFTPLGLVAQLSLVLLVHPSVQAKDVAGLIALAKANPGKFNFASSALGTGSHMCAEMFRHEAGIDMNLIPYKGSAQLVTDLVGGHVQASFAAIAPSFGNIKAGNLRALAVTSPKRSSHLPEVPTVSESGLAGFEVMLNYGLLAPAGTPKPIVDKINAAMRAAIASEDVRKRIAADGGEAVSSTPEEYRAIVDRDMTRWSALIKKLNLKVE